MESCLIAARVVHYAATISLTGVFAFLCLVAAPDVAPGLRRRLALVAWASFVLALLSGGAWLLFVAAGMSGQPLAATLTQGVVGTVLTRTRFGQIWVWRVAGAMLVAILLLLPLRWRGRLWRWAGLALAAGILATLAWAGHGGSTPGRPGELHLAADIVHLIAAGIWIGSLLPFALLLAELRQSGDPGAAALARRAVVRFSVLAAVSVAALLAGGLVNTWFLAGSVPALIGTEYGRLLLAKIAIFVTMVTIAAVNLLRMTPRLMPVSPTGERRPLIRVALGHLRRNALVEAGLGLCVLCIVAVLGILPPGLHTEPGWPLPFRLELVALPAASKVVLAILLALAAVFAIAAVATAAAGRYRMMSAAWCGLALCLAFGWPSLRPAVEPAYPTTFYAPAEPYAASSVEHGAHLYAENCVLCHGTNGKGDGPAAPSLTVRPADLTAPHLFMHTEGDLFWWIGNGKADGVMPGFAAVLSPAERWDLINFIRARAAGMLARETGPEVTAQMGFPVPDFAFEQNGRQRTLSALLKKGPVLLVLFTPPSPAARLAQLAAAQRRLAAASLAVLAIDVGRSAPTLGQSEAPTPPPVVAVAAEVASTLALFGDANAESELMLDRAGDIRARWTQAGKGGLADIDTLVADAGRAARLAPAAPNHAGHVH